MRTRGKIAITVDPDLLKEVERLRKKSGETRSAVFERALASYLAGPGKSAESRRYVDAYRRQPESAAEIRGALANAMVTLAAEPWDAKG